MARILVINPNSSAVVTAAMDRALDPLRAADGPEQNRVTCHRVGKRLVGERRAVRVVGGAADKTFLHV